MNLIKFITESGLVPLQKGQDSFVPIYKLYFDMLQGDLYACFVLGELLRLQNSPQAQENGGWVVLTYQTIKSKYYMSKHVWDKAIEALKPLGLTAELRQHPRYPDARTGVWHYRVDEASLVSAVVAHVQKQAGGDGEILGYEDTPLKNFDHPPSKILTTPPKNFSCILDIDILDKKDLSQTYPEDISEIGNGGETPNVCEEKIVSHPSMVSGNSTEIGDSLNKEGVKHTSIPPAPTPVRKPSRKRVAQGADVNHGSHGGYQQVFACVSKHIFQTPAGTSPQSKRVGLIAGYLWGSNKAMKAPRPTDEPEAQKAQNICKDVEAFVTWWSNVYTNANLPLDLGKFAHHWLKFWQTRQTAYAGVDVASLPAPTSQATTKSMDDMPVYGSAVQMLFKPKPK